MRRPSLVVSTQPSSTATAGVVLATQPVIVEEDAFDNIVTSDNSNTVTVARGAGTAALQGVQFTVTLVNGVATFSSLSYNKAEIINLTFASSVAGVAPATSNNILVSPNNATQLVMITQPSATATAGVSFAIQPVVAQEDAFGNIITADNTHTVTVARGTGTSALQGGPLTVTLTNGVATFSGVSTTRQRRSISTSPATSPAWPRRRRAISSSLRTRPPS